MADTEGTDTTAEEDIIEESREDVYRTLLWLWISWKQKLLSCSSIEYLGIYTILPIVYMYIMVTYNEKIFYHVFDDTSGFIAIRAIYLKTFGYHKSYNGEPLCKSKI